MSIENLIIQWQESVSNKKQRDSSIFCYSLLLGRIPGINYFSAFSRIIYRWWNILHFVIHIKMDCTIIKAERMLVDVLIKLIVIWKGGKRWTLNCWVIWRDRIFVFGCSRLTGWWLPVKWDVFFCFTSSPLS